MTDKQKIEVLKAQLKFRKEVLLQVPGKKSTFNLTKTVEGKQTRKNLSVQEFTSNLKALIQQAIVKDQANENTRHLLVGKRTKHRLKWKKMDRRLPVKLFLRCNSVLKINCLNLCVPFPLLGQT